MTPMFGLKFSTPVRFLKIEQGVNITSKELFPQGCVRSDLFKRLHLTYPGEEEGVKIPLKKRILENAEKENKKNASKNSSITPEKGNKILKNSPVPSIRSNAKASAAKNKSSDDEIDSVFDEMLSELNKSGFKIADSTISPKRSTEKQKGDSLKKRNSDKCSPSSRQNKSKKVLLNEFEELNCSDKLGKRKSKSEKKICELEELPEDIILNFKRTPKKETDSRKKEIETEKEESVVTPRRSTRRKSAIQQEATTINLRATPSRKRSSMTPSKHDPMVSEVNVVSNETPKKKSSSTKKSGAPEPKTPTNKVKDQLPTTPLEKARVSLHVSTVPESLPCREKEYNNILNFLENKLVDGIGGCMYISGVPGTGKTATVTQVIRNLQEQAKNGTVPDFKFIEINGMRLSNPRQAYVQLWQKLFNKKEKITPDRAQRLLDNWFSKSDRQTPRNTTVLLVDELDLICTKKQDVVYNLLDWPTRTHSRLVVLTIANTMDMPERLFKGRVTSRMGLTRLTFMPYTHKQLEEIVLARLQGLNAFVTDAVRLVTRKVAAVSGDARRALDICRRATELPPPDETVKITHIEQAVKEMTNSNIVKLIRNCGQMERLFLLSLSDVSSRSNTEEVDLRDVIDQLFAVCVLEGISRPSISSVLSVSNRLKCCRLIFANQSSAGVLQRLTLNVTQDDIHYALRT